MPFFKSRNQRLLDGYTKLVKTVTAHRDALANVSDGDLKHKTLELKQRLQQGAVFKSVVPEGLAIACAAAQRALGLSPYDVQIVGALVLLDGKIGEMRTGEGKTLTAALAAFVRSLDGKGVHVVTVNDYLARRDAATMEPLFAMLGQRVGVVYPGMDPQFKVSAYAADITYATNNEIGFDYLRDNMAVDKSEQNLRGLHYAIVDEVDSILIDEARTPLIISGPHLEGPDVYQAIDTVAQQLVASQDENGAGDYWADAKNKQVLLSEQGMERAEQLLKDVGLLAADDSLYAVHNISYIYHLNASLRAYSLYQKDVAYLVRDGQVQIVDEFTGRIMSGRRWGDGLHQALEVKEGVAVQPEQQTVASVTLQNLFRGYTHLSGMTGTADTEAGEFMEIYGLEVVVIPTHRPMVRTDAADMIFLNINGKLRRVVNDIKDIHARKQPILVGTASIEMSERLSHMLTQAGIAHNVLNAKQHDREAKIVAEAGVQGAVTIATNMAGRGTDILLGGSNEQAAELRHQIATADNDEVKTQLRAQLEQVQANWLLEHNTVVELGGLHIIGTERHESRRIDNQLRGRSGRQGDPGSSQFYISFEDPLMALFASDFAKRALAGMGMKEDDVIAMPLISRQIERAQRSVEAHNFNIRKNVLDYDNVANEQRKVYYQWREDLLAVPEVTRSVLDAIDDTLENNLPALFSQYGFEGEALWDDVGVFLNSLGIPYHIVEKIDRNRLTSASALRDFLLDEIQHWLEVAHSQFNGEWLLQARSVLLTAYDVHWREHLSALDTLRKGIHLRGFAQKQPKQEYKREAFEMFRTMLQAARFDAARGVMAVTADMLTPSQSQRTMNYIQDTNWLSAAQSTPTWNTDMSIAAFEGGVLHTLSPPLAAWRLQ